VCGTEVTHPCLPGELVNEPRVRRADPSAIAGPGMRSRSVVVVPSLPLKAPQWASANRSSLELD
jgi:hypothetical protein